MPETRLIDANALKEKMTVAALGGHMAIWVRGVIDDSPTVDAVKRGKWECQENMPFESCSICRHRNYDPVYTPNFCPNCGAKMEKKELKP